ncbi:MAG: redox-sensing transcriptional repressor Rex [Lachnospiraceae bacterium]|nr:redox-sensing transcriptional repressor Rex [Lachnospiraceae bacterium]
MEKEISQAVIRRLPRYYRYLGDLLHAGVERISSNELSVKMHVTASQIRQDLNNFGGFGQQGYGYNVPYLYEEIGKILGLNHRHNVIVIGVGNLGHAIANYISFERLSFTMIGAFDVNPELKGKKLGNVEVQLVDEIPEFLKTHDVDLAALTLPKESAEAVTQKLIANGVKAFWNFAHVDLDVPEGIVVQNVHLSDSLMQLSYNINQLKD